jgi:hypothetical protein
MNQYTNDGDFDHEVTTHAVTMRPAGRLANDTDAPVATDLLLPNGTVPQPDGGSSNPDAGTSIPLAHREDGPAELLVNDADVQVKDVQPNGDDADARMAEIEEVLDHAATPHLDKCELVAEWVHHAEAKFAISGQLDRKSGAGRPQGGIARAARELPLPGKSEEARRKFVERAIFINCIWPEVKSAARKAKLDNIQSALLDIAGERSLAAQVAKVAEVAARKAAPRRKSRTRKGGGSPANADTSAPDQESPETLTANDEAALAALQACWNDERQLRYEDWSNTAIAVRRRFVRNVLLERPVAS